MNKLSEKNIKQKNKLWKLREKSNVKLTEKIVSDFCTATDENFEVWSYLIGRGI